MAGRGPHRDLVPLGWGPREGPRRGAGRDVAESASRRRLVEPLPDDLHPALAEALARGGHRRALGPPGRRPRGGPPRAHDRHHRHGERQVAGLQPAGARHARRATSRPAPSTSTPRRRWPRTRPARSPGSAGASCATRSTTATPRARSAAPSVGARTSSSPTRTCCTWACFPTTAPGATCWPTSPGSWSTRRTSTAACSARTWPTCCAGCAAWRGPTGPSRASCSPAPRSPTPPSWPSASRALEVALVDRDGAPRAERQIAMWNPPLVDERLGGGPRRCPRRRACWPRSWSARCARSASSSRGAAWS